MRLNFKKSCRANIPTAMMKISKNKLNSKKKKNKLSLNEKELRDILNKKIQMTMNKQQIL